MLRTISVSVIAALLSLTVALPAGATPVDTTVLTIQDTDGDNMLEFAPGEDYVVFGADEGFRPPRDGSILNFLQMSDFQIIDEESPGRVEFLDTTQRNPVINPASAAYRPHESLTTQLTEAMVRAARNTRSPITQELLDLAILTGDNADSQQFNETRWFIDILDGHKQIDPNSGVPTSACPDPTPETKYDGPDGEGEYYDPDASGEGTDGDGYSPDRVENGAEVQRDVMLRDFPGLLENAQEPFEAIGLDLPWYSAFGNHDALVQGNSSEAYFGPAGPSDKEQVNPTFMEIVTGCFKPTSSGVSVAPGTTLDPNPRPVPPDERRCYLAKDEGDPLAALFGGAPCATGGWISQHFETTGLPVGHGFAPAPCTTDEPDCAGYGRPPQADLNNDGYYSFSPSAGVRFVVLDTVTDECGSNLCSEGSVDHTQFEWLRDQIETAAGLNEYVLVFSHHTLRTIRWFDTEPTEHPVHYGQRYDGRGNQPQNVSAAPTLEELFCEHTNVIAHVAGHEHENYVEHHECSRDDKPIRAEGPGDFWHISTAAHLDWPQQSRMIELIDNGDGTISLALTMLDHAGPPNPGGPKPCPPLESADDVPEPCPADEAHGQAPEQTLRLASIGREIAYNDYQGSRGARGAPEDRNVIIVIDRPWLGTGDETECHGNSPGCR